MKKYTFSKEICYSKRLKARTHLKYALTCSLSVLFSAGLVVGLTLGVVHNNNYTGQGGADYDPLIEMKPEYIDFATLQSEEPISPVGFGEDEVDLVASGLEVHGDSDAAVVDAAESEAVSGTAGIAESGEGSLDNAATAELDVVAKKSVEKENYQEDSDLYYTVYKLKNGETASLVASMFKISLDTILSVNGVTNATRMATGTYLRIPSLNGILYEVNKEGETLEDIVRSENKLKKINLDTVYLAKINNVGVDEALSVGHTLFLCGDKLTNDQRAEISGTSFKKPLKSSYYISSPFGWRVNPFDASKRSYHNGLDMACPTGTPIYSTAAGTVVTAGYTSVYGNYVIIKHTSGYKSLYGHMSQINVKYGQYVDQGTIIGKVGSTGQSTGPHLHFTIYKNDKAISPYEKVSL